MNTIKGRLRNRLPGNYNRSFSAKITSRLVFTFLSFIILNLYAQAQKTTDTAAIINSIFPRGEKVASAINFNGTVWLNRFISGSDSLDCIVSLVTFQPGVRTNWHIHPGGQILIVTEGIGYYQEKGKPKQIIRKGDIVKCAPGAQHWHGASPDSGFAHLVVAPDIEKGEVTWLQRVTEEEYSSR